MNYIVIKVSYVYQGCIDLIRNTIKTVILLNIFTL